MLARRAFRRAAPFTRRDASRLIVASTILVAVLAAVLAIDILPSRLSLFPSHFTADVGELAPDDVISPRTIEFTSEIETEAAREAARAGVPPQYGYTPERGQLSA
ncbi:MAG: hypothetical protein H0X16_00555, partial [Chloroflexi bacterium]|nr:hypothetical protein [Chloroflexota bacterium]